MIRRRSRAWGTWFTEVTHPSQEGVSVCGDDGNVRSTRRGNKHLSVHAREGQMVGPCFLFPSFLFFGFDMGVGCSALDVRVCVQVVNARFQLADQTK